MEYANIDQAQTAGAKAATTRRIRRRAAQWRGQTRREPEAVEAKLAEHINEASKSNHSRPPLSAEAVAWNQLEYLSRAYQSLASARRYTGTYNRDARPGYIGGLRLARIGTAELLNALQGVTVQPQPTRIGAIEPGDMIEHGGTLSRVLNSQHRSGDPIQVHVTIEGGQVLKFERDDTPCAIRPADFKAWNDELKTVAAAESTRRYEAHNAAILAFDDAFMAAHETGDMTARRQAIAAMHSAWPEIGEGYGAARSCIKARIACLLDLDTSQRTKWRYGERPYSAKGGFAGHCAKEARLLARMAALDAMGLARDDTRAVATIIDIWGRKRHRVSMASLRGDDWVKRVNAAGEVTRRTGSIQFDRIAAIVPAKRASKKALAGEVVEISSPDSEAVGRGDAVAHEGGEAVDALCGLPTADAPVDIEVNNSVPVAVEAAQPDPDPIAELAARIERLETALRYIRPALKASQAVNQSELDDLDDMLAAPLSGESSPALTVAKRTPAHERAIRRAWAMRAQRNRAREVSATRFAEMRRLSQLQIEANDHYRARLDDITNEKAKRRRSIMLARDLRKRGALDRSALAAASAYARELEGINADLRCEALEHAGTLHQVNEKHWKARADLGKAVTFERQRADTLHAQLAKLRSDMQALAKPTLSRFMGSASPVVLRAVA